MTTLKKDTAVHTLGTGLASGTVISMYVLATMRPNHGEISAGDPNNTSVPAGDVRAQDTFGGRPIGRT